MKSWARVATCLNAERRGSVVKRKKPELGEGRMRAQRAEPADGAALGRPPILKSKKERPASKGRVHKGRTRS
ncbi:MAG TPA: hypothetical protein VEH76_11830 [Methylocystis sp.]|nr:hypothetical protein [Methylocystis sp.]